MCNKMVYLFIPGTNLDEKDDDEKGFEWINTNHPRMYATAAVAEQNSLNCSTTYNPYTVSAKDATVASCLKQQQQSQHQHQHQQQHHPYSSPATVIPSKHQTFITASYNTMIPPHNKYSHVHKVSVFIILRNHSIAAIRRIAQIFFLSNCFRLLSREKEKNI